MLLCVRSSHEMFQSSWCCYAEHYHCGIITVTYCDDFDGAAPRDTRVQDGELPVLSCLICTVWHIVPLQVLTPPSWCADLFSLQLSP